MITQSAHVLHRVPEARHETTAVACLWSSANSGASWRDASLGLRVCGDWLGGGGLQAAWHSGDELAVHMAASSERVEATAEMARAVT